IQVAACNERHARVAAEREQREGDRQLAIQIVAFTMEERMLLHVDDDVEIAGRAAGAAVLPSPVERQRLAGRDARRDLRRQLALAADAARAAARLTRTADDAAPGPARRARGADGEGS